MREVIVGALGVAMVMACGGMVEPEAERGCVTSAGIAPCSSDFYVFRDGEDGESIGDQCTRSGCEPGERCAVFVGNGVEYGKCR